jgi:hypothetical protein
MQKICLKIPGVAKPHSILGKKLFEDERYLVIADGNIHRKIPWDNILYIEEIVGLEEPPQQEHIPPADPPVSPDSTVSHSEVSDATADRPRVSYDDLKRMAAERRGETPETNYQKEVAQSNRLNGASPEMVASINTGHALRSAQVIFEGFKEGVITVENVPSNLLTGEWTPELSRHIFGNTSVRNFMGGFNVEKMTVASGNVYIQTRSAGAEKIAEVEDKVKMMGKMQDMAKSLEKTYERPSMKLDNTFGMTSSPFDAPISLAGAVKGVVDDNPGEEEGIS